MTAAAQPDRCQATTESARHRTRCSQKAVGRFERTRARYANETGDGPITVPLGRLCRRHAKAFGAEQVTP